MATATANSASVDLPCGQELSSPSHVQTECGRDTILPTTFFVECMKEREFQADQSIVEESSVQKCKRHEMPHVSGICDPFWEYGFSFIS